MQEDCLFCRIVAGEIPADITYEDAETVAIRDINPQAPVHVLVLPRRHVVDLAVTPEGPLFDALFAAVRAVAEKEGLVRNGFRAVINSGRDANQTVPHLHIHVMGGRSFSWPPG
jgi:histidine triad (HIT) family protein